MEKSNLAFKIESCRIDSRISLFIIFLNQKKSSCHNSEELKEGDATGSAKGRMPSSSLGAGNKWW